MFEPNRMKDAHLIEAYEILVSSNKKCINFAKKQSFFRCIKLRGEGLTSPYKFKISAVFGGEFYWSNNLWVIVRF